jgi:hypothetical protein
MRGTDVTWYPYRSRDTFRQTTKRLQTRSPIFRPLKEGMSYCRRLTLILLSTDTTVVLLIKAFEPQPKFLISPASVQGRSLLPSCTCNSRTAGRILTKFGAAEFSDQQSGCVTFLCDRIMWKYACVSAHMRLRILVLRRVSIFLLCAFLVPVAPALRLYESDILLLWSVRQNRRWFKYDRDWLCVNKSQFVPVIFEPPCINLGFLYLNM